MTNDLYLKMQEWLASGIEAQRVHARNRLAMPDAVGYVLDDATLIPRAAIDRGPMYAFHSSVVEMTWDGSSEWRGERIAACGTPVACSLDESTTYRESFRVGDSERTREFAMVASPSSGARFATGTFVPEDEQDRTIYGPGRYEVAISE